MRDGERIPAASYIRQSSGGRRKAPIPRLLPAEFTSHLSKGATLVLDAVDELYEPLTKLAADLELIFHEHVQINAYAGWHSSHGFDIHWDDHDVFVLQVAGRKLWSIYGMTRPHPLAQDSEPAAKPDGDPVWEAILEDGDFLYIPRGWWHVAHPMEEPTLHLTVGIHNRSGIDLLQWLVEKMRAHEVMRADLPRFACADGRSHHMQNWFDALVKECGDDVLDRYLGEHDALATSRANFSLPWSATSESLPPSTETRVRLTAPRRINFNIADGVLEFYSLKKRWRFAEDALAVLNPLNERRECSIGELCDEAQGRVDESTVRKLLGELLAHGLLAVIENESENEK